MSLEYAKWFAAMMHHGQKYDDKPYTYHLGQVEMIVNRFGFGDHDTTLRICAWLHDIIEDVPGVTYPKIRAGFGKEVADIVFCVTNQMGRNRKEKFKYTYPKIRENKNALVLKLADRIANIENGLGGKTGYASMYKKEWPGFKEALFDSNEQDSRIVKMWEYLESLFGGIDEK